MRNAGLSLALLLFARILSSQTAAAPFRASAAPPPPTTTSALTADSDDDGIPDNTDNCPLLKNNALPNVLNLDGAGAYVALPPAVFFDGDFTIEAWVFPRSHGYFARILDFGNGPENNNVWFGYDSGSGRIALEILNGGKQRLTAPDPLPLNQWTHVAASLTGTTATIYYNGKAQTSGPMNLPVNVVRNYNYLGRSNWGGDAYLDAYLSDMRIWNYARTQPEITAAMNYPLPDTMPGLIAYWRLGQTGASAPDATGSGYHGALQSNAAFMVATRPPGFFTQSDTDLDGQGDACDDDDDNDGTPDADDCQPLNPAVYPFATELCDNLDNNCNGQTDEDAGAAINTALQFDGTNDFVLFNSPFILHQQQTDATFSFWVKRSGGSGDNAVFWTRENDADANRFNILYYFSNNLNFDYRAPNGNIHGLGGPGETPPDTWVHIAVVRSGNTYDFYKNGVLATTATDANPELPNATAWTISGRGCCRFNGQIDEIRFWNYAQSASEIQLQMHRKLSGKEPGLIGYWDFDEGAGDTAHDRSGLAANGLLGNGTSTDMPQWVASGVCLTAPPDVSPVNAVNDQATVPSSSPVNLPVLANDLHSGGLPLRIVGLTQPAHGTAQIAAGQAAITYTSASLYAGKDTLYYFAGDTLGNRDTAAVLIKVKPPQPDLLLSAVSAPPGANSGQPLQLSWVVKNAGPVGTNAPEWTDRVWLSADTLLQGGQDALLGSFPNFSYLLPGESYANQGNFTLANGLEGVFYLIVETDAGGVLGESREDNNTRFTTLQVVLTPSADLRVTQIIAPDSAFSGTQIQVSCTIQNFGNGVSNVSGWYDQLYFGADSTLQFNFTNAPEIIRINDLKLGSAAHDGALQPDSAYTFSISVTLPAYISGKRFIKLYADINPDGAGKAFEGGNVLENNAEFNNTASVPIVIKLTPHADLEVAAVKAPAQASPGETIPVEWTVANNGFDLSSAGSWPDGLYWSADTVFNPQTALFARDFNKGTALGAGQIYQQAQSVKVPQDKAGPYYLYVLADRSNQVFEGNFENNNTGRSGPLQILTLDLLPENLIIPAAGASGMPLALGYSVKNQGQGQALTEWSDRLYLSPDSVFNSVTAILLSSFGRSGGLGAGASRLHSENPVLPNGLEGKYYVFLEINATASVFETEVQPNNRLRSTNAVDIALTAGADLQVTAVSLPPALVAGNPALVEWNVRNAGLGATSSAAWTDNVWLSADAAPGVGDLLLASTPHSGALLPGGAYTQLAYINLPVSAPGGYYLIVQTDAGNAVYEYQDDENNNALARPATIQPYPPVDLVAGAVQLPASAQSGQNIAVSWQVTNIGSGKTLAGSWHDLLWLSTDTVLDAGDWKAAELVHTGFLDPGGSYTGSRALALPNGWSGAYYLIVKTNATGQLPEADLNNNLVISTGPVEIALSSPADLLVSALNAAPVAAAGQPLALEWTVKNAGAGATGKSAWFDGAYLSDDAVWSSDDLQLGSFERSGALDGDSAYTVGAEVELPAYLSGNKYLILRADHTGQVYEHNAEGNNSRSIALQITVPPPCDLVITGIAFPAGALAGEPVEIQYTLKNQGANPASGYLTDALFLSADSALTAEDALFAVHKHFISLSPGASAQITLNASAPGVLPGNYRVFGKANIKNNIKEGDLGNNAWGSGESIAIDLPVLVLDVQKDFSLQNNHFAYFKLEIPDSVAGNSLRIALNSYILESFGEIYGSFSEIPSPTGYTYKSETSFSAGQVLNIPTVESGIYFFMVSTYQKSNSAQNFSLLAKILTFQIVDIFPKTGGKGEKVTLKVTGYSMKKNLIAILKNQKTTIATEKLYWKNDSEIFATFDLSDAEFGQYQFEILQPRSHIRFQDDTINPIIAVYDTAKSLASNLFNIIEKQDKELLILIDAPIAVRVGGYFEIRVYIQNISNFDKESPILWMYTDPVFYNGLTQGSLLNFPQKIIANAQDGPPGTIRPGEFATVVLKAVSPNYGDTLFFNAEKIENTDIQFDLLQILTDCGAFQDSFFMNEVNEIKLLNINSWEKLEHVLSAFLNSTYLNNLNGIPFETVLLDYLSFIKPGINFAGKTEKKSNELHGTAFENNKSSTPCPPVDCSLLTLEKNRATLTAVAGVFDVLGASGAAQQHLIHYLYGDGSDICHGPNSIAATRLIEHKTATKSFSEINSKAIEESRDKIKSYCGLTGQFEFPLNVMKPNMYTDGFNIPIFPPWAFDMVAAFGGFQGALANVQFNIKSVEDCQSVKCQYSGYINYEFVDVYSFDDKDCQLSVYDAAGYNLENCGWVKPFNTKIQISTPIGGLFIMPKPGLCLCPPCPKCIGECTPIENKKSFDPNDIIGPPAYTNDRFWVARSATLPYTIRFENDSARASAPAQVVNVSQKLDPHVDVRSFRLGSFGFGPYVFQTPPNQAFYNARLDLRDSLGIFVDVLAGVDVQTNTAFWTFKSIDPATGLQPNNPLKGFLAVNDSLGNGQGFVSYTVRPDAGSATGDTIFARARIVFDINAPIETPQIFNTIDASAPVSHIGALPANSPLPAFALDWSGADDTGGCGIRSYDIYVSENNGPFQIWADDTTATAAVFQGQAGRSYAFYSRAADFVGNLEPPKPGGDAMVSVDPDKSIVLLEPAGMAEQCAGDTLTVRWTALNVGAVDLRITTAGGALLLSLHDLQDTVLAWPVPPDAAGTLLVTVADTAGAGVVAAGSVWIFPLPIAGISLQGDSLLASGGEQYQWLLNGDPLTAGANGATYHPLETGNYSVIATDANGCSATSAALYWELVGTRLPAGVQALRLAPNPAAQTVTLTLGLRKPEKVRLRLCGPQQQLLEALFLQGADLTHRFDLTLYPPGVYFLSIDLESGVLLRKVVKL